LRKYQFSLGGDSNHIWVAFFKSEIYVLKLLNEFAFERDIFFDTLK